MRRVTEGLVVVAGAALLALATGHGAAVAQQPAEVRDAVTQFNTLKHHGEAIGWLLREDRGAPDPSASDHYQGVARYPGTGTPVLYATQLDDDDELAPGAQFPGGYLLVARMGSRPTTGERLRSNLQRVGPHTEATAAPVEDTYVRSIRFDGTLDIDGQPLPAYKHPGGMAIIDDVLLMSLDQPQSYLQFDPERGSVEVPVGPPGQIVLFDLRADREDPRAIHALPLDHSIDNLAVTRRDDGSPLIWINGDGGKETRFYTTSSPDLRDPDLSLTLIDDWNPGAPGAVTHEVDTACENNDWPRDTDAYQGSTFLRETGGALFLMMMRNTTAPNLGCDLADLYRVEQYSGGAFHLTRVASREHYCNFEGSGRICTFGAGAGGYVSPSGELVLYSIPHDDQDGFDPDVVRMAEFRHRDVSGDDSPLRLPTADAGGPYTVDEGATAALTATGRPRADRPWVELYENDHFGERSIVVDHDDRDLLELFNFDYLDVFGDLTTSVRWRAPVGLDIELFVDHDFGGRRIILKGTGETQKIEHLTTQVVIPGVVEHPGRDAGDALGFNDATSSLRWTGAPLPSRLTFAWDLDGDGAFDDSAAQSPTFGPGLDDGVSTAGVRVTDAGGAENTDATTVTVRNVAPRIESHTLEDALGQPIAADPKIAIAGLPVGLDATFTDPGVLDTQTARVDWRDGSGVDSTFESFTDARSGAVGRLADTHVFLVPGAYEILVTITDDDGGATQVSNPVEVLSPEDAIENVAARLTVLIDAATDDDVEAALRAARDDLVGNHGGTPPTNGAQDKLEENDPAGAITKLRAAISNLEAAEANGGGDLSALKDLVGLIAEAIATREYGEARMAVASPSRGEERALATIAALIEEGHRRLGAKRHLDACGSFQQATSKAVQLAG